MLQLAGNVAVVTGAGRGIGRAIALALGAEGVHLVLAARNVGELQQTASEVAKFAVQCDVVPTDVSDPEQVQALVDRTLRRFDRIDILVNCVGTQREEAAESVTEEAFDRVYNVNLKGAMFQAQAAARHMIRQGTGGKQVHMGSVRSHLALRGRGYAAYCATKGGLGVLCKQLAAEWAPYKINVNVVAPTFVRTPLVEPMLSDPVFYNELVTRIPLGRLASPQDVMSAIAFLVSPAADFITGQKLFLDGGLTATQ